jgi:hypothetical protein
MLFFSGACLLLLVCLAARLFYTASRAAVLSCFLVSIALYMYCWLVLPSCTAILYCCLQVREAAQDGDPHAAGQRQQRV